MTLPVWTTVRAMRDELAQWRRDGDRVVLVPTMGDLHEGHLSLVRAGRGLGRVIASVFVNPTQFAPGEDYESYPRRLEEDCRRLEELGAAGVFAPSAGEMYGPGEATRVEVRRLTDPLCGAHREGHFLGVTTICTKLFIATGCEIAVFGQKDAQQCIVIERLVRDLHIDCDLIFSPTVREPGGLAMSSRNRYLEPDARERARALSAALGVGRQELEGGTREPDSVEVAMLAQLRDAGVAPDYAELRTVPDLERPERVQGRILLAAAAYVGKARLIDNLVLDVDADGVADAPLFDHHTPDAVRARWGADHRTEPA